MLEREGDGIMQDGPTAFGYGIGLLSPICGRCKHLQSAVELRCRAFGDQLIPEAIWTGLDEHVAPVEGDHGIRFTPKALEERAKQ